MPVSAADEGMMLYNGVELPNIDSVWTDKETYPYVFIVLHTDGTYRVQLSAVPLICSDNLNAGKLKTSTGSVSVIRYKLVNSIWNTFTNITVKDSSFLDFGTMIWSNFNIVNADGVLAFTASPPVDPNASTGTLEIQSSHILDDSASFVVSVSDLASTESIYSIKAVLSSDGTEVKSTVTDTFAGTSNEMHLTVANLEPETAYDISFILQKNGTDTTITASTSFTTLAGSAAGEGETPDYTGQLNEIQISVDNVGTKLDGVQETLTETKEEITSLPEKIATSITEGVKGLFIPSQEDLTAIKDEYEDMLSEKLGFIWQAYDLLTGFISDLQTNLESGEAYEFTFPGIKLPMQGEEFVLVAETPVSLENELMDVLRPVLGTIVSVICVSAFVNMAHDYVLAIISGVSAYQFERRKD